MCDYSPDGTSAGDMQKKLMEKIEEPTIYIIQQYKRIQTQEARIKHPENKK